jgi:hypothetical protein
MTVSLKNLKNMSMEEDEPAIFDEGYAHWAAASGSPVRSAGINGCANAMPLDMNDGSVRSN